MNKNYALNELMAEKMAYDFFRKEFNHSGKVGVEKRTSGTCDCGESLAIEFYSKEDPGMDDTYTVIICESCYNELPGHDKQEVFVNSLDEAQNWLDEYVLDHTMVNEIKDADGTVIGFEVFGDQPMTGERVIVR